MKTVTPEQLLNEIDADIRAVQIGVTDELAQRIVDRTPADTGTTRGNVLVDTTSAANSGLSFDSSRRDPGGSDTKTRNTRTLKATTGVQNNLSITSLAPWSGHLEFEGTSSQAPAGMFGVTLSELDNVVAAVRGNWSQYRD